ncbi:hypothetical protein [Staphylococcus capitis]|uniref:hypothetical protein n=1 Tax=Staphylococcus capitis TaxID=29388 RepID=UPI0034CEC30E
MEILDCIIDTNSVTYEVKTSKEKVFQHTLSIETPTYKVIEILALLSDYVDKTDRPKLIIKK